MKAKAWWNKIKKWFSRFLEAMAGPFDDAPNNNYDNWDKWWMN